MNTNLQKIYDEFAETYDKNRGLFDMTEVFDSFYERLEIKKGRLLDMGCGAGEPFPRFFIDRGWTVTGVDFNSPITIEQTAGTGGTGMQIEINTSYFSFPMGN